jgi:hypothetical protein
MKMLKTFLGVALIILAVAIAVVPHFNTCQYNGKLITLPSGSTIAMKCTWSAQAEIMAGAGLLTVGILALVSRRKETISFLTIIGIVLGAAVILVPTRIIGVCSSLMPCHTVMQPFLVATGGLVMVLSAVGLVVAFSSKENKL